MGNFEERINLNIPLEDLSKIVCEKYNLGKFISNKLIEVGYEDFNYILKTNRGGQKYVVKIFSQERSDEDCLNLAQRATMSLLYGFSSPKIYSCEGKNLCVIEINNVKYRLLVMEYINGKDFFSLNELPNDEELKEIAYNLAKLNNIEYKPAFIYDKWAIINFENEYNLNKHLISEEDKTLIEKALKEFKTINFKELKYGFVHGDIIVTNIIKDKKGKLYFIDFSVSNYQPRIVDLAVSICDLCLDEENFEESKKKAKLFLTEYERVSKLSDYEKECLKIFIKCHQAITIIETTREKDVENNTTIENEEFLQKGKIGLKLVSAKSLI